MTIHSVILSVARQREVEGSEISRQARNDGRLPRPFRGLAMTYRPSLRASKTSEAISYMTGYSRHPEQVKRAEGSHNKEIFRLRLTPSLNMTIYSVILSVARQREVEGSEISRQARNDGCMGFLHVPPSSAWSK